MIIETPERPKQRKHTPSESAIQMSCVQWLWQAHPETRGLYIAIPNENSRSGELSKKAQLLTGAIRKNMGVTPGVADTALFMQRGLYGALFIEFKTEKGLQSKAQEWWQDAVQFQGYKYVVVRSLEQFKEVIEEYLNLETKWQKI